MIQAIKNLFKKLVAEDITDFPQKVQHETFTVYSPTYVGEAVANLREDGWVINDIFHNGTVTEIVATRESL